MCQIYKTMFYISSKKLGEDYKQINGIFKIFKIQLSLNERKMIWLPARVTLCAQDSLGLLLGATV